MIDESMVERVREPVEFQLERHRRELTAYCYRMLGSTFDADDAVEETFFRAWRSFDSFRGRASLRSWLFEIATNVCLDALSGRERRARPIDLGPAGTAQSPLGRRLPDTTWLEPIPDPHVMPSAGDPRATAEMRQSMTLAFLAALQHLAPKQRALLILRDIFKWKASEVAELLGTTAAAVDSALHRARSTLANDEVSSVEPPKPPDEREEELLVRYVDAFESYDIDALISLLHRDATWTMPPYELWLNSHADIRRWCLGPGIGARGSRLVRTRANASPAFAQYRPAPDGRLDAWSLQILEVAGGKISAICFFLDIKWLLPAFGLPSRMSVAPLDLHSRPP